MPSLWPRRQRIGQSNPLAKVIGKQEDCRCRLPVWHGAAIKSKCTTKYLHHSAQRWPSCCYLQSWVKNKFRWRGSYMEIFWQPRTKTHHLLHMLTGPIHIDIMSLIINRSWFDVWCVYKSGWLLCPTAGEAAITVMTNNKKSAERIVYISQHAGFTVKV